MLASERKSLSAFVDSSLINDVFFNYRHSPTCAILTLRKVRRNSELSVQVVNCTYTWKTVEWKPRLKHCHLIGLSYRSALFFLYLRLIALSFPQGNVRKNTPWPVSAYYLHLSPARLRKGIKN